MVRITEADHLTASVGEAFQLISYSHPADYVRTLAAPYEHEESPEAKAAMAQILVNSRISATHQRPICQDTGIANVLVSIGVDARVSGAPDGLQPIIDEGVRRAYRSAVNPLRNSIVVDPLFERINTSGNTPAVAQAEMTSGDRVLRSERLVAPPHHRSAKGKAEKTWQRDIGLALTTPSRMSTH
jgi:fumarate hydratase, class I